MHVMCMCVEVLAVFLPWQVYVLQAICGMGLLPACLAVHCLCLEV